MSPAKALVLDFGGVVSRTLFETHDLTEEALGLARGTLSWRGPFDTQGDANWRAMQAGEMTERDYWQIRVAETGALLGETWTTFPQLISRARGDDPLKVIRPEFHAALAKVKAAGRRLAILSNELDLFYGEGFRAKLPFLADFELIVDASHNGILKPDPRAYAFITDGLGLAAQDCVFVDDQPKNIRGGIEAGMQCVSFDVTDPAKSYAEALTLLGIE